MSSFPKLKSGLVLRYEYLWREQALKGRTTGEKERPVCVVVAIKGRMVVVPITHSPPQDENQCIEIPTAVNRHLGLDDEISYINVAECNLDSYPSSPDLRRVPETGEFSYGLIPQDLLNKVRAAVIHNIDTLNFTSTNREEDDMTQEGDLTSFVARR
jgi:hypothetical protein